MKQRYFYLGVVMLSLCWLLLSSTPTPARAQVTTTPPPPPPQPTTIPLGQYQQAASSASANAQVAGSRLAQAQADYAQAQVLAAQANAKLVEAKQARDQQLLEQSVTLSTQAKDLADRADAKIAAAEKLMGDAQAQIADQSAHNVALTSDLTTLHTQLEGTAAQLSAVQQNAADLRGQIRRTDEQVHTLIVLLSFSLVVAAVMALVMMRRTHQAQELLRVMATVLPPAAAPAPEPASPTPTTVVDESGTLLYEENTDEELSLMLANVFRANPNGSPNPSTSGA